MPKKKKAVSPGEAMDALVQKIVAIHEERGIDNKFAAPMFAALALASRCTGKPSDFLDLTPFLADSAPDDSACRGETSLFRNKQTNSTKCHQSGCAYATGSAWLPSVLGEYCTSCETFLTETNDAGKADALVQFFRYASIAVDGHKNATPCVAQEDLVGLAFALLASRDEQKAVKYCLDFDEDSYDKAMKSKAFLSGVEERQGEYSTHRKTAAVVALAAIVGAAIYMHRRDDRGLTGAWADLQDRVSGLVTSWTKKNPPKRKRGTPKRKTGPSFSDVREKWDDENTKAEQEHWKKQEAVHTASSRDEKAQRRETVRLERERRQAVKAEQERWKEQEAKHVDSSQSEKEQRRAAAQLERERREAARIKKKAGQEHWKEQEAKHVASSQSDTERRRGWARGERVRRASARTKKRAEQEHWEEQEAKHIASSQDEKARRRKSVKLERGRRQATKSEQQRWKEQEAQHEASSREENAYRRGVVKLERERRKSAKAESAESKRQRRKLVSEERNRRSHPYSLDGAQQRSSRKRRLAAKEGEEERRRQQDEEFAARREAQAQAEETRKAMEKARVKARKEHWDEETWRRWLNRHLAPVIPIEKGFTIAQKIDKRKRRQAFIKKIGAGTSAAVDNIVESAKAGADYLAVGDIVESGTNAASAAPGYLADAARAAWIWATTPGEGDYPFDYPNVTTTPAESDPFGGIGGRSYNAPFAEENNFRQ